MKNVILLLMGTLLFTSCKKDEQAVKTEPQNVEAIEKKTEATPEKVTKADSKTFAVVWRWTTTDGAYVTKNVVVISKELQALVDKRTIENVYFDSDSKTDKLENLPNVTFFIKAESKKGAATILDKLTIVKKNIAKYSLHPVGKKWLGRKDGTPKFKSFVAIWTTTKGANPDAKLIDVQRTAVTKLFEAGNIENIYFDVESSKKSDVADLVFFVNARTEKDARAICDALPFSEQKIATYQMFSVGVHWIN